MRNKQLPFILTAAMCLSPGMTVTGTESSEEMVISELQEQLEGEALGSSDVEEEPAEAPEESEGSGESESSGEQPSEDGGETEEQTSPASESETEPKSEKTSEQTDTAPDTEGFQEEEIDMDYVEEIAEVAEEEKYEDAEALTEKETEIETEKTVYGGSGSVVSDGGTGELYVAVHGYPVGNLTENEQDVYVYLRKNLGLNKAAASGVLANVYFESNFSSVAVGDGGTSLGLCQWHLGRCKSLISWCDAHNVDYRSVEGQLGYLDYELNNIYKDVYGYLLGVPDTADGAYRAGYYFCMYYESPSDTKTRSEARGTMAKNSYYASNLDKFMETTGETVERRGIKLSDRARLIVQIDKHS